MYFGETIDSFARKGETIRSLPQTFCQALEDLWTWRLLRDSREFYYSVGTFRASMNHSSLGEERKICVPASLLGEMHLHRKGMWEQAEFYPLESLKRMLKMSHQNSFRRLRRAMHVLRRS